MTRIASLLVAIVTVAGAAAFMVPLCGRADGELAAFFHRGWPSHHRPEPRVIDVRGSSASEATRGESRSRFCLS